MNSFTNVINSIMEEFTPESAYSILLIELSNVGIILDESGYLKFESDKVVLFDKEIMKRLNLFSFLERVNRTHFITHTTQWALEEDFSISKNKSTGFWEIERI